MIGLKALLLCSASLFMIGSVAEAATLFAKGKETFKVLDDKGKTPKFRVLDDGTGERALAVAIAATLNSKRQKHEKAIPVGDHLDVAVETIELTPSEEKSGQLDLRLRLSGRDWDLEQTVDREKFISGEWIDVKSPQQKKTLAIYEVDSTAKLRFRLNVAKNELEISEGSARLSYQSDWAGNGEENISFKGKGLRAVVR